MPRRVRHLFPNIVSDANLEAAWREARRGKRRRPDVARFELEAETRLADLGRRLRAQRWRPRGYRVWVISDPKPRLIAAAPVSDRVVHHAVHRVLAPELERRFMDESFACRAGRGTHRAALAFLGHQRRFEWVARLDVQRYFLEIDWDRLLAVIGRQVDDPPLLALLDRVLRSGGGLYASPARLEALGLLGRYTPAPRKGVPIGSLLSQLFANTYLDGLDHFIKRELRVPGYVRYMDDFALFGRRRREVAAWAEQARAWVAEHRGLALHDRAGEVRSTRTPQRFVGFVLRREPPRVLVSARTMGRMRRRLREAAVGELDPARLDALEQGVRSFLGSLRI